MFLRSTVLAALLILTGCATQADDATTTTSTPPPRTVVSANEYSFSPAVLDLEEPTTIELRNIGGLAHTWTVLASEIETEVDLATAEVLAEARVEVGQSAIVDIAALGEGSYQVVCAIPGHFSAGMEGRLVLGG